MGSHDDKVYIVHRIKQFMSMFADKYSHIYIHTYNYNWFNIITDIKLSLSYLGFRYSIIEKIV